MKNATPITIALFYLLCTLSAVAQTSPEAAVFHFHWPSGVTVHVEQEWTKINNSPEGDDTLLVHSTNRMQALSHPEGLLIRTDSFNLPDMDPDHPSPSLSKLNGLLTQSQAFYPDYIVDADGKFLRVENLDRTRAVIDSLYGFKFRQSGNEAALEALLSTEQLTSTRREEWNTMVGRWRTEEYEIGETYEGVIQQTTPLAPGFLIPIKQQLIITRWTGDKGNYPGTALIQLYLTSEIDSTAFMAFVDSLATKLGKPVTEEMRTSLQKLRIWSETTLVTDPATLLPYSLVTIKSAGGYFKETAKEKEGEYLRKEIRSYRFIYEKPQ